MPFLQPCVSCRALNAVPAVPDGTMVPCWACGCLHKVTTAPVPASPPPSVAPPFVATAPEPTAGDLAIKIGFGLLFAGLGYKIHQSWTDTILSDSPRFPAWYRELRLDDHISKYGSVCPGHGRGEHPVTRDDLTIDHIRSWFNGGLTSHKNAAVLCRSCNSRKNSHNTMFELFIGNGGREFQPLTLGPR